MPRSITIINKSTVVKTREFVDAVAAVSAQASGEFASAWGLRCPVILGPDDPARERIYVVDDADQAGALGYHTEGNGAVPVGYVFARTAQQYGEAWSATLSHEVLEQIADPFCNGAALGFWKKKPAMIALEVCDPVENSEYDIAGVKVSNFVTPLWFNPDAPAGSKVDWLGQLTKPLTLDKGGFTSYVYCLGAWHQAFADQVPKHQLLEHALSRRGRRKAALARAWATVKNLGHHPPATA